MSVVRKLISHFICKSIRRFLWGSLGVIIFIIILSGVIISEYGFKLVDISSCKSKTIGISYVVGFTLGVFVSFINVTSKIDSIGSSDHGEKVLIATSSSIILTFFIWGLGISLTHVIPVFETGAHWIIPRDDILNSGTLVGSLLGVATIAGLLITLAELRDNLRPKAYDMSSALEKVSRFIDKYCTEPEYKEATIKLCGAFPTIGVANIRSHREATMDFLSTLRTHADKITFLTLPLTHHLHTYPQGPNKIWLDGCKLEQDKYATIASDLQERRPANILEAFIGYVANGAVIDENGVANVIEACNLLEHFCAARRGRDDQWEKVSPLPDYHVVIVSWSRVPVAAFILVGIRLPGFPYIDTVVQTKTPPPMIGLEIHDSRILTHLNSFFDQMWRHAKIGHETTAPPPSSYNI